MTTPRFTIRRIGTGGSHFGERGWTGKCWRVKPEEVKKEQNGPVRIYMRDGKPVHEVIP